MSCKQDINVDQDCYFLTYLEGCQEKRLYPPMQLQENDNFVVVYGTLTPNQFSISKDNFDVDLNGENYTDKNLFIAQMSLELNCINDKYAGGGGGGGTSNVTITADSVGLARKEQFDCKYTGHVIDLTNPDGGIWPDFPFDISEVDLVLQYTPQYQIPNFGEQYTEVKNTKELAAFLNTIQNYFYFVDVGATSLGIMEGKLPINWFSDLAIATSNDTLEYTADDLTYQTATQECSTQDKILLELQQNAQRQNAPKGLATRRETLAFPNSGLALGIAPLLPYRDELVIRNNSNTNTIYIGYFDNASDSEFTFPLEPTKTLIVNSGHKITGQWEAGATSGEILITEII